MIKNQKSISSNQAFTIVELLVVIVVIGILAAITIVSYSGIQNKAIGANLRTDLVSDANQLKMYNVEYGHYPSSLDTDYCPSAPEPDTRYCLKAMNGAKLAYNGGGQFFTLFDKHTATGITYKISEGSEPMISVLPGSFINKYQSSTSTTAIDSATAVDITDDDGYIIAGSRFGQDNVSFTKFGPDNSISLSKNWQFGNSTNASAVKHTSDGGVVVLGYVYGGIGFGYIDSYIAKFSSTSELSWMKLFGTTGDDMANGMAITSDGGYAVTGMCKGLITIFKFSKDGALSWTKSYGSGTGNSIVQTSDSGFAVTGYINGLAIVFKTDQNGEPSWVKTWKNSSVTNGGENAHEIIQTSDGGYAISGTMYVSAGKGKSSILKLASDGAYQWHKYLEVSNNLGLSSIIQAYDGGYVVAGSLVDAAKSTTTSDVGIAKISPSGVLQWSRSYGDPSYTEYINDIALTADGGYLIVGIIWDHINGDNKYIPLVMKYKSDGTMNNCVANCKSGLVYDAMNSILFTDASLVATSQAYTSIDKTYIIYNAPFTQTVVAAP